MTQPEFQLLAYDFDGTLADTRHDIARSANHALAELGLRTLPVSSIFSFIGRGVAHLMTCSLEGTGFKDVPKATDLFMKHYAKGLLDETQFYPGCREALEFYSSKKQAVLSNKPERFIRDILRHFGCEEIFCSIIGGDSVQNKKPNPEGALKLVSDEKVDAGHVLFIGDSPIDIETGKNSGMATCAVTWGLHTRDSLEKMQPDFIIDSIEELYGLIR